MTKVKINRDSNFEVLRIISMFMIVVWHVCLHGVENYVDVSEFAGGLNQAFYYGIKSCTVIAVNIYVLISGYFLCNSNFKWSKVIRLILETLTFSVGIYIVLMFLSLAEFSLNSFLTSSFPIFFGSYWFVSVYVVLYLLSPYINIVIKNLTHKSHFNLIILLFLINCGWQFIYSDINLGVYNGYGLFHFIFLYILASYIRFHGFIIKDYNKFQWLIIFVAMALINMISNYIVSGSIGRLYSYNSPLVVLTSYSLFMAFKNIHLKASVVNVASSYVFGIYLIHEHPMIRDILWGKLGIVEQILYRSSKLFILDIVIFGLIVFMSCWVLSLLIMTIVDFIYDYIIKLINWKTISNKTTIDLK
ncbi:acyltransferase [Bacillus sp. NTK071]|uniref:acyltransferase n=1 Tax=Bacillus sp. NTK071 TaxID=2802175 RepID=UPI001A8D38A5|nr:acyltransferase [Bacillus sp. NTK071]MBN8210234.1 acyltransferase [Bacillus sp. NTK071]